MRTKQVQNAEVQSRAKRASLSKGGTSGGVMEVHSKPVHSWRELLSEIGVIVIGVIIALAAEQAVETIHWRHKVADAELAMRRELSSDLAYAAGQMALKNCAGKYFDRVEDAIRGHRQDTFRALAAMNPPFGPHPWVAESWTAAIGSEIPDHISREKLAAYAIAFRRVATERDLQFAMLDRYGEVVGGRDIEAPTPEVIYAQLAALNKLKADHGITLAVAQAMLNVQSRQLGVAPDPEILDVQTGAAVTCEKQLKAIPL